MRAFLAEDAKALEDATAGDLQSDLRKYFWFRGVIHGGDKAPVPPKAAGQEDSPVNGTSATVFRPMSES
jgi:hypothetical protein